MGTVRLTCLFFSFLAAAVVSAQPKVTAWQLNYSFTLPGTPHYAAAQGSLIVIYGTGLGPERLLSQGFNPALDRNPGGVSVRITVGSTVAEAIPYYVSGTQIAAIVPSSTPIGEGTLAVRYNGTESPGVPIRIVQSVVGLLSRNGFGTGPAAVYDTAGRVITRTNAANPGDTIVFWGTGVGPDSSDETRLIATPRNLDRLPFEFYIGGKLATVIYRGRSSYPGVDQMNVVVPNGVSGCAVSAYAKTGAFVSNFTTLPVATTGKICSDEEGFSAGQVSRLDGKLGDLNGAYVSLGKTANWQGGFGFTVPPGTVYDEAMVDFQAYSNDEWQAPFDWEPPSAGNCVAWARDRVLPIRKEANPVGGVSLKLPDGTSRPMTGRNPYSYSQFGPGGTEPLIPNSGGAFQIDVARGLRAGPFTVNLTTLPPLQWTNKTELAEIDRTRPLEVTWTGAPRTYAVISGYSASGQTPFLWSAFYCTAPGDAGRFTVPADILSHMLKSLTTNDAGEPVQSGQLELTLYRNPSFLAATGLDYVISTAYSSEILRVNVK